MPRGNYSAREKLLRMLALVGIFALVIWAFWEHTGQTMRKIQQQQAVYDATDSLSKKQLSFVRGFASNLKSEYGLEFRMQVSNEPVEEPRLDSKTVFLGVDPASKQVVVRFPPLLSKSLGPDFLQALKTNHLASLFDDGGDWREGITYMLAAVWERLAEISGENNG
jgi:hypothetical protein